MIKSKHLFYKNYKVYKFLLFFIPLLLVVFISVAITYNNIFFIEEKYKKDIKELSDSFMKFQKKHMKYDIEFLTNNIISKIQMDKINHKEAEQFLIKRLSIIRFVNNQYIFVFKQNKQNKSVEFLVNPNMEDEVGKIHPVSFFKDFNNKLYIKDILEKLESKNGVFHKYKYKVLNQNRYENKLSYIYYLENFDWYIGTGVYMNEIEELIKDKKKIAQLEYKENIRNIIFFTMFLIFIVGIALYILVKYINIMQNKLNSYDILEKSNTLRNLELSEILNMVAHQWRHPLSHINARLLDLYDENFNRDKFIKDIEYSTEILSHTIDDFVDLYSNNSNNDEIFSITNSINNILHLFSLQYMDVNFKITSCENDNIKGNSSKLKQVLLIVLSNSLDAFNKNKTQNPKIYIYVKDIGDKIQISILDNAGGIDKSRLDDVFNLYYTTKEKTPKSGIGLFLAKMIVKNSLKGTISLKNKDCGVKTTIKLHKI